MNWWKLEQGPVYEQPPGLFIQHTDKFIVDDDDMDSDTVAESDMSLVSRSFLWSSAKDSRPILKRCNTTQYRTFLNKGNVHVFDIGRICFHGEELLRQLAFHQEYRKRSHNVTDVRHIWKVDTRTIRWDLWSEYNLLGWFFMETFIFDLWWRSHQSLARRGLRIFRFCVMLWKEEREPTIKYCLGGQVDVCLKFITIQSFGHNWWWANGIRVAYFPRIHHIAVPQQSPRVPVKKWA